MKKRKVRKRENIKTKKRESKRTRKQQNEKIAEWVNGGLRSCLHAFSRSLSFASPLLLLALFLLFISSFASCKKQKKVITQQPVEKKPPIVANVSVDKSTITIGEKIRYTITVEANKDIEVKLPDYGENLGEFAIQDFETEKPVETDDGRIIRKRWYLLDTYLTGPYTIPPATVKYKGPKDKEEKEIKTTELFVEVKSVAESGKSGDTADIREIADPVDIRPDYREYYLWGGLSLGALLLIVGGGIALYMFRRGSSAFTTPPRPAYEIAYEELQRLLDDDLISKGQIKEFYFRLSDITRHYIENRFHLMAPERTTEEFLTEMANTDLLEQTHKDLVAEFLDHCDLVKFAKYGPTHQEIENAYIAAKRLVDETREMVEEEYEEEGEEEEYEE